MTAGKITGFTIKNTDGDVILTASFTTALSATGLQSAAVAYLANGYTNPALLDAIFHAQALIWGPASDADGFPNMTTHGTAFVDKMTGGRGEDTFFGSAGADIIDGGQQDVRDTVSYAGSKVGITITLGAGGAQTTGAGGLAAGDKIKNIEAISGSEGADKLTGNELINKFDGGGGNDLLKGGAGNDFLQGGEGNDTIEGGAGADFLDGGAGTNTLSYAGDTAGVDIHLQFGTFSGLGDANGDTGLGSTFANLIGGSGNDTLTGGSGANTIDGGAGDDTIDGFGNLTGLVEKLVGGTGTDTLLLANNTASGVVLDLSKTGVQATGGYGNLQVSGLENVVGTGGSDTLLGTSGVNKMSGGNNDDLIEGRGGADILDGELGDDTVSYAGSSAGVTVDLTKQDGTTAQTSKGDASGDILLGFERMLGSKFADTLTGDAADNIIEGGAGNDVLDGGDGTDRVSFEHATAGVTVNLSLKGKQNTAGAGTDTLKNFEQVFGSKFNDTLTGDMASNFLAGGKGNDVIEGGGNGDFMTGGDGIDTLSYAHDTAGVSVNFTAGTITGLGDAAGDGFTGPVDFENITGGSGNDFLVGSTGNNVLDGGDGNDTIEGLGGSDVLKGGAGVDTLELGSLGTGVKLSLALTTAQANGVGTMTVSGFENLFGTAQNDVLTGDKNGNVVLGMDGDDVIEGGAGADVLSGGNNGSGGDTVSYEHSTMGVTVDLTNAGVQVSAGDANGDVVTFFENIRGSAKADTLTGDGADNIIEGGAGNDTIAGGSHGMKGDTVSYENATAAVKVNLSTSSATGGAGSDTISGFENLLGSKFADTITGDGGDNVITGGLGADILTGGTGADTFVFRALSDKGDHITDFVSGVDKIAISGDLVATDPAPFDFGSNPTAGAGASWFLYDTDDGKLYFDADGSGAGAKVLLATLDGHPTLVQSDFFIL